MYFGIFGGINIGGVIHFPVVYYGIVCTSMDIIGSMEMIGYTTGIYSLRSFRNIS